MIPDPTSYTPPAPDDAIPVAIPPSRKAPDDSQLAARWITYNRNVRYGLGEWRRYQDGIWSPVDEQVIRNEVLQILERARAEGVKVTNGLLSSVTEISRTKTFLPAQSWDATPDFIPVKNGVLYVPDKTLLPHTPDIFATTRLDFDYDPDATCPNFMQALCQISEAENFLQEFAGYALTTDMRFEIAVWMQGSIGSGKSTVIGGLQTMLGSRHGILGLRDVERSRFALTNLPGKTLVVSTEQPDDFIKASDLLNSLISGEPITVEMKFRDPITFISKAKILWAMNNLPRINEANNGLMRRVKVIKFPILPEDQRDPDLKNRIALEGAGILNWALAGLERLRLRGKFEIPKCVADATKEFQEKNDIPALFLEECNAKIDLNDPQHRTAAQDLYDRYSDWCKRNGHKPMSSTKVAEEWKRLGFERSRINGTAYWVGVKFDPFVSASNVP